MRAGVPVDARATCGLTPLSLAAADRRPAIVERLLDAGADVDGASTTEDAMTPLLLGAEKGSAATVQALLDRGADAGAVNWRGHGELHLALVNDVDVLATLLASEVPADATATPQRWTPLMMAAQPGRVTHAAALLGAGAGPRRASPEGWTPLLLAADARSVGVASALLRVRRGVDLSVRRDGYTALHLAATAGGARMVKLLLRVGAAVDGRNPHAGAMAPVAAAEGGAPDGCGGAAGRRRRYRRVPVRGWPHRPARRRRGR